MSAYYTVTSSRSRVVAFFLCLFFGILGIHNFYVGKIFWGLIYLLTLGFFGIGWIIDLIRILLGTFRDGDGVPLRE
ncbi:MAG: TM2 domain-containing protein [Eubacterium sp.]|nr:TM2 domain-containing protein [Eubacterium sp.]